ncbi:MAG: acetyl-CoA carboxylase biotin carboxyl carrier protein [Acetobacteraceae bacterium]|nr:acetyl-CoA carboxylase biotin carboxyl carrier protein [Acetobacteraceae bacterium]
MSSGIQFDPEAIRALAQILKDTDLSEIEVVEKDSRLRVARTIAAPVPAAYAWPPAFVPPPAMAPGFAGAAAAGMPGAAAVAGASAAAATAAALSSADAVDPKHPGLIASPMVGVVYLAPEPGAAPFVTLGSKVAQGQTLLLIEAMKTFNQVRAPRAGTVTRILVEAGTPVEYGEPLMVVE